MLHWGGSANPLALYRNKFSVQIVREVFKSFFFQHRHEWLNMNGGFEAFEKNGGDSKFCWYCWDIFAKNAFDREGWLFGQSRVFFIGLVGAEGYAAWGGDDTLRTFLEHEFRVKCFEYLQHDNPNQRQLEMTHQVDAKDQKIRELEAQAKLEDAKRRTLELELEAQAKLENDKRHTLELGACVNSKCTRKRNQSCRYDFCKSCCESKGGPNCAVHRRRSTHHDRDPPPRYHDRDHMD